MPPVKCRSCGKLTPTAVLCMYCGKHLEEQVACPKCSRKLVAGSKSCQYCGAAVSQPAADPVPCRNCGRKMAPYLAVCQMCGTPALRSAPQEDVPAVLQALDRGLERDPLDAVAHCNRGTCLNRLNRRDEAAAAFQEAVRLDPKLAMGWNNLGDHHKLAGRFQESLDCFDRAIECDPKLVLSLWGKASVLRRLERPAEALPVLDRAEAAGADPAVTDYLHGECLQAMKQIVPAMECFQRVVGNPKASPGLQALAVLHGGQCVQSLGARDDAMKLFAEAARLDPQNPEIQEALAAGMLPPPSPAARLLAEANDLADRLKPAEALAKFDLALEADPAFAAAWRDKSAALAMLQRYPEALACAVRALELDPVSPNSWMNRALAEDGLGRTPDALKSYHQFIRLAPAAAAGQVAIAKKRIAALSGGR